MATNNAINLKSAGVVYYDAAGTFTGVSTSTALQMLQSGASVAPSWSTATWPATTTVSQLLYSSSANTVAGLATANSAVLLSTSAGVPVFSGTLTNGQTILGSTGATPVAATITGSNGITVTTGSGTLALSGTVVQTVFLNAAAGSSTTSTTYVDVTSATLNITPTSASNKIRVTFSFLAFINNSAGINPFNVLQVLRGASVLSGTDTISIGSQSAAGGNGSKSWMGWEYVDSPASTSALTYKLQHKTSNGSVSATTNFVNIILQEIVA